MFGEKIRELRLKKNMTLTELAGETSLTASYISQLERNLLDPSLSSLRKIASALEVPVFYFLDDRDNAPVVIRSNNRVHLKNPDSNIFYEYLTPTGRHGYRSDMEVVLWKLHGNDKTDDDMISHPYPEFIFLMNGQLRVFINDEYYDVFGGDSILIRENSMHNILNLGKEPATAISFFAKS